MLIWANSFLSHLSTWCILADPVSELSDMHSFKNKSLSETSPQWFSKTFRKFVAEAEFLFLFRCSFCIFKSFSIILPLSIKPIFFSLQKLWSLALKSVLDLLMFHLSFHKTMLEKAVFVADKVSLIFSTYFCTIW